MTSMWKLAALAMFSLITSAQFVGSTNFKTKDLPGLWQYVDTYTEFPDGTRKEMFGDHPLGYFSILENGHYTHIIMRPDLPKLEGGLQNGTPEQYKEIATGNLSHFGMWKFDESTSQLSALVQGSSYPNLTGTIQVRRITHIDGDVLKYIAEQTSAGPGTKVFAELRRIR